MKLVTIQEMREIERAANAGGHSYAAMMERAGSAVASAIAERTFAGASVLALIGPGNNGGDGLVAAAALARNGYPVTLYLWRREDESADGLLARAAEAGATVSRHDQDANLAALAGAAAACDVLIDALLGTGAHPPLRNGAPEILAAAATALSERRGSTEASVHSINGASAATSRRRGSLVVAVDIPSGMDADTGEVDGSALRADVCVTFAQPKLGHVRFPGAACVGELLVADIGTPPAPETESSAVLITAVEAAAALPQRPLDSHKGTFGRVLVVAGSTNYVGAPALAGRAAYRIGAGLVTLAVPAPIQTALAAQLPEATYLPLPSDLGVIAAAATPLIAERASQYQAMVIGPGMTQERAAGEFLMELLEKGSGAARTSLGFVAPRAAAPKSVALPPCVLDADALNLLAKSNAWWRLLPARTVLTPHPAEMARLLRILSLPHDADRIAIAREAATAWGCTVVLKGAFTVVATPGHAVAVIPFGEPALATAGTGDVLAGTIAGLLAQGLDCHKAAWCGAYLHGLAGARWAATNGHAGLLAGELADALPLARRALASLG